MANLLKFKHTDKSIGLVARSAILGPETTMLETFVEQYTEILHDKNKYDYALFFEPLVPTGYPDLVVVRYLPSAYNDWKDQRVSLQILDLKVLHHLHFIRETTSEMLERQLGMRGSQLLQSLERLMDSNLIKRQSERWIPTKLQNAYSIRGIKAVEAKISDWNNVFMQAGINRLFATESYVLSPVANPSIHVVEQADKKGVGIFSLPKGGRFKVLQKPLNVSGLPVSYASWLFNEWIGRRLMQGKRVA